MATKKMFKWDKHMVYLSTKMPPIISKPFISEITSKVTISTEMLNVINRNVIPCGANWLHLIWKRQWGSQKSWQHTHIYSSEVYHSDEAKVRVTLKDKEYLFCCLDDRCTFSSRSSGYAVIKDDNCIHLRDKRHTLFHERTMKNFVKLSFGVKFHVRNMLLFQGL